MYQKYFFQNKVIFFTILNLKHWWIWFQQRLCWCFQQWEVAASRHLLRICCFHHSMDGDTRAVVQAGDIVKVGPWLVRTEEGRRGCTTRTPAPPQQLIYTEARRAATAESSAAHPGWGSSPASYWRPVLCTQVTSPGSIIRPPSKKYN